MKREMIFIILIFFAWNFPLFTVSAGNDENVIDVAFQICYEDTEHNGYLTSGEYLILQGLTEDGNVVWEKRTETYPRAQLEAFTEIGFYNDMYYYGECGTVVTLNREDGSVIWTNSDGGALSGFDFGEDGTIYICGYFGPDFVAVDRYGNTLCCIEQFDQNYYWPYRVEYQGSTVFVTFEGYREGGSPDGVFMVNLNDFCYTQVAEEREVTNMENKVDSGALPVAEITDVPVYAAEDSAEIRSTVYSGDISYSDLSLDGKIEYIRDWYYTTQNLKDYLSSVDRGKGQTAYYDGENCVKVTVRPGRLDSDRYPGAERLIADYYYHDGLLYFAFLHYYEEEYRYYLEYQNGDLCCIRYIDADGVSWDYPEKMLLSDIRSETAALCGIGEDY